MITTCNKVFLAFLQQNQLVLVVIVAVLAARFLIRRLPIKYSYLLWGIVGLRMMLTTWLPSPLSLFHLCQPFRVFRLLSLTNLPFLSDLSGDIRMEAEIGSGLETGATGAAGAIRAAEVNAGNPINVMLTGEHRFGQADSSFLQMMFFCLFVVWIVGIAAIFLYGIASYVRCRRLIRQAVRLEGNVWECDNLPSPFVWGVMKPRIYLPFHLPEEARSYILEHECCHIRRRDPLIKLLAFCLLAVYWINPLVWLSYYLLLEDLEISCDEAVLKRLGNGIKRDYSSSLLAFAVGKRNTVGSWEALFAPLAFGKSNAFRRIQHVLNYKKPGLWGSIVGVLAVAVIAVLCLTNQPETNAVEKDDPLTEGQVTEKQKVEHQDTDGRYQIYPEVMEYMTMTYPEYQKLTGGEMEHDRNGFYIGSLPDSEIEITMQGRYNSERGIYIDERAKFVKLQGKLSELVSIPQEDFGNLSWRDLIAKLCRWEDMFINWGEDQTNEEIIYGTDMAITISLDCDEDGEDERLLTIFLQDRSLLDKIDPDATICLEWRGDWG